MWKRPKDRLSGQWSSMRTWWRCGSSGPQCFVPNAFNRQLHLLVHIVGNTAKVVPPFGTGMWTLAGILFIWGWKRCSTTASWTSDSRNPTISQSKFAYTCTNNSDTTVMWLFFFQITETPTDTNTKTGNQPGRNGIPGSSANTTNTYSRLYNRFSALPVKGSEMTKLSNMDQLFES